MLNPARVIPITEDDQAEVERRRRECSRRDGYQAALDALRKGQDREAAWVAMVAACSAAGVVFEDTDLEAILAAATQAVDHEKAQADAPVERKLSPRDEFLAAQKAAFAYFDAHHAIVTLPTKAGILNEIPDATGFSSPSLLPERDFCFANRHKRMIRPPEEGEKHGRMVQFAQAWIDRPETPRYRGMGFYPPPAKVPREALNLWKGWPHEGKPVGSCKLFLEHVEQNICSGDVRLFGWMVAWFADLVQNPGLPIKGTAIILRGERGTGKTLTMDTFGRLFGSAYSLVAHPDEFLGRFNAGLETCLLLGCDEGTWGGDRKHESLLKSLITGERRQSERKFQEAAQVVNRTRIIVSSNNDWVIPAGPFERRFLVLDVKPTRRGDNKYFAAIKEELDRDGGSGYAALFCYLRGYRIPESCDLRKPPETAALGDQKIQSLDSFGAWWTDCLHVGSIGPSGWPASLSVADFYTAYLAEIRERGYRHSMTQVQVGRALARFCPGVSRARERGNNASRYWAYRFPVLNEARCQFEAAIGSVGTITWLEEGENC